MRLIRCLLLHAADSAAQRIKGRSRRIPALIGNPLALIADFLLRLDGLLAIPELEDLSGHHRQRGQLTDHGDFQQFILRFLFHAACLPFPLLSALFPFIPSSTHDPD